MGKSPLILIVQHGAGRAFADGFLVHALEYIGETDPGLRQSIVCHGTGEGGPSLEGVSAILFALGDPLRQSYPLCFSEAAAIAARADKAGIRVVNSPQALSNTSKTVQARIWTGAGIATPSHTAFDTKQELLAQIHQLAYPVMLKSDHCHRQQGMRLCHDVADMREAVASPALKEPVSVASFVDTREDYRKARPVSLWAEFYHKKRALVLGDVVRARHLFFSRKPIVSLLSCTLYAYERKRKQPKKLPLPFLQRFWRDRDGLARDPVAKQSIAEDNAFFSSPPDDPELLRRACKLLGLEVATIDYSVQATGELVLWEANSFTNAVAPERFILASERHFSERSRQTFDDFKRFLAGLLHGAAAQAEASRGRNGAGPAKDKQSRQATSGWRTARPSRA